MNLLRRLSVLFGAIASLASLPGFAVEPVALPLKMSVAGSVGFSALRLAGLDRLFNDYVARQQIAGAGLLSTASDYGHLMQMLLDGGELDGVRLLSPKTVELMHTNQAGDKYAQETNAFGLGLWVLQNLGYCELGSEGAYGWSSAYYPHYVIDPKERLAFLFMTQLHGGWNPGLAQKSKVQVYQALEK